MNQNQENESPVTPNQPEQSPETPKPDPSEKEKPKFTIKDALPLRFSFSKGKKIIHVKRNKES